MKFLKIKAHYIPYSKYATYLSHEIKTCLLNPQETPTGAAAATEAEGIREVVVNGYTNGHVTSNGKSQNPEFLLAWVRVYTKFFMYVVITFAVGVFIPITTGPFLNK